jgi:hypothetical protein
VYVDTDQIEWLEETLEKHPAADGWKVVVFTNRKPQP